MLRVLIAEDEEMIRKGLVYTADWLSMDCVVVAEAADGRDGYEKILEYRPDVVITDICMPFMDGIEMIKKASEQVRFKSILLTSYADFEYARRAIEARVCEYLLKPVVEYYMQLDLSENQYVSRAIKAIREDFARKLSIESISDDLGVSASYLSRKFKEVTGQTFLDFLNKYRVQQAIVMLGTRQYRISEISEATGFTDYKHFCSVFKKYTSKSPTKFIKGVS